MSNFFPVDIPVCAYAQILFEKGNLMVIVMNVDFADQKSRRKEMREILRGGEVCLDARVSFGFTRRNDLGETWLFFPSAFPSFTGESSATRRQGAPSTRIIRRFFTSDKQAIWLSLGLFEENMFLQRTPGSPTSGKSRSPLSTWHCFYAFVNIKAKRLGGRAQIGSSVPSLASNVSWPLTWRVTHRLTLFLLIAAFSFN